MSLPVHELFGSRALKTQKKTGQYQSAPWSGSHDYAGQQQGGADASPGSMEHWPRASFRWFVGMTGAPLIINFSCCGNNALDSWHIDIWRLVVRWNICLLRFWNFWHESSICKLALRFHWKKIVGKLSAWFAGQHATAFCANVPIKAVRQKQGVLLQLRAIDFLLAIVCVSYLHSAYCMCVYYISDELYTYMSMLPDYKYDYVILCK